MAFLRAHGSKTIHRTDTASDFRTLCGSVIGGRKTPTRLAGIKSDDPHYCQRCRAQAAAQVGGFSSEPSVQQDAVTQCN